MEQTEQITACELANIQFNVHYQKEGGKGGGRKLYEKKTCNDETKQTKKKVQSINVNVCVITVIQKKKKKKLCSYELCKSIIYFLSFFIRKVIINHRVNSPKKRYKKEFSKKEKKKPHDQ